MTEAELLTQISGQLAEALDLGFNLAVAAMFGFGWIAGHQR